MTMQIQVHYFGMIKRVVGQPTETVTLPKGSVLADLLQDLVSRYGAKVEELLMTEDGQLRAEAGLQVNGRSAALLQGLATPLNEEDKAVIVALAPPLLGGAADA